MPMSSKVFRYHTELTWKGARTAAVVSGDRPELVVIPPGELSGGADDQWTPEHLFLASMQACMMLSFLAHCAHNDLEVAAYSGEISGTVERRPDDRRYAFTRVEMTVRARMAPGAAEAARGLVAKAERDCYISASSNARVDTDWRIDE
jgi:organic hydroperoxide reductase OsmC/OhrA